MIFFITNTGILFNLADLEKGCLLDLFSNKVAVTLEKGKLDDDLKVEFAVIFFLEI